ncbi:hypothetical protein BGZ92_001044 [Podila epicladia]|nr:hypothetical protein BGZ92_001044 [Podila epicladia]
MHRLTVLTLAVMVLYAAQSEAQSLQATLNMNGVEASFKFTPLGPGIPGARVEITGVIKVQAVNSNEGFKYHIHEKPTGPNNDCMATGGHLDPLKFGDGYCNPAMPDKCQEGDLSGRHGSLKPSAVPLGAITYVDKYLRWEGADTTIVGRSVVVHNNGTRIACGDLLPAGSSSHGVASSPVAPETNGEGQVERQMVQGESGEFATAATLSTRHNGAMSGLDERVAAWTLATSLAAGVVAALMAL